MQGHLSSSKPPPEWGEWVLIGLVSPADRDAILGDFAEMCGDKANEAGMRKARLWYVLEIVKCLPSLCILRYRQRRRMMGHTPFLQSSVKPVGIGFLLMIPALLLCGGGLLQSLFGVYTVNNAIDFSLFDFHPAVILSGVFIACILNLFPVLHVAYKDGDIISTLHLRGRGLNLTVVACIGFVLMTIFIYLLAENFQIFAGV